MQSQIRQPRWMNTSPFWGQGSFLARTDPYFRKQLEYDPTTLMNLDALNATDSHFVLVALELQSGHRVQGLCPRRFAESILHQENLDSEATFGLWSIDPDARPIALKSRDIRCAEIVA